MLLTLSYVKLGTSRKPSVNVLLVFAPLHIANMCRAVLFSLRKFTVSGKLNLKLTSMQKLQAFHHAKPYLGSTLKAESLKLGN